MRFRSNQMAILVLATALSFVVASVVIVRNVLHGLMTAHYRPPDNRDVRFALSPQGDKLVFNARGQGGRDLYLLDLTMRRVTRIAETPEYEVDPKFSPDGLSVVYAAGVLGDRADHLFIRALDGSPARQLTAEDANDCSPAFSRDGSLIVFTRDRNYRWGGLAANWSGGGIVCVMRADGSDLHQITTGDLVAFNPQFLPDGKRIFYQAREGLFTIAADGLFPEKLAWNRGGQAVLSPDGELVAFRDGKYSPDCEIFVTRMNGSDMRQVTETSEGCYHPVFTLDGQRIVYFIESWPNGPTDAPKFSLWQIGIDGRNRAQLADSRLFDDPLGWKP